MTQNREEIMAHIVVLGAGLGGAIAAYEIRDQLRKERQNLGCFEGRDLPVRSVKPVGRRQLAQAQGY
jgi:hypothetical protein